MRDQLSVLFPFSYLRVPRNMKNYFRGSPTAVGERFGNTVVEHKIHLHDIHKHSVRTS